MTIADLVPEALLLTRAEAIVATDRDGVIRLWNPGAVRIFGFASDEALGQSLDLIIPAALRARHWAGFRTVMTTGHSRYGEGDVMALPASNKQGQRLSIEFTISMLRDAGGAPVGMVSILRDVTARFEEARSLRRLVAALTTPTASGS